ncbi:hypothetical protein C1646_819865, partial [Rhizophagus diaphanus]
MHPERKINNIIEMETSFNCVVLSDNTFDSLDTFSIDFYKKSDNKIIAELGNKSYEFDKFKVDQLRNYICDRNNVPNSGRSAVKLWKVNIVDEVDIKEKLKDEMNPRLMFIKDYFENELNGEEFTLTNIHVIAIISTTAGQKRPADPESAETGPKRRKRFVHNQEDLEKLISEIQGNVIVGPPPELYPELSRNIAGRFHKEGSHIPISGKNFPDMRLNEQSVTPMGQKLTSLFKEKKVFFQMIYGVSGAGKTRAIFDMARSLFIIYIDCAPPRDETMASMEPTNDINFSDLVKKISGCFADMPIDKARIKAGYLIALEFVARVFYLILLKKLVMDLSPQQYLLAQINGGQTCIADIKYRFASYEFEIDDLESIFRISLRYLEEQL